MRKKELIKRYILFIIGLFFAGIGVAFTKHGELGVSPISSVANVMSLKFDFLTIGSWLIIWNCVLILGQIVLLRKEFKLYQLLQIPLSFLFGYFTDFGMWIVSFIPANSYFARLLMLFIGIAVLAFGISLSVIANVIMNSGEAIVKVISDKTGFEFGNVKVVFDISCVAVSIILSLIFFDMKIIGTREGTILSAILTGFVVKFFTKLLKQRLSKLLEAK
ncbi:MAG: YitT family protein [Oscillospiraceae bacterium]|nr:YitT family protein [Oscillospiraceae bacterium]